MLLLLEKIYSISSIVSGLAKGSQEAINNSDGYDKINSRAAENRRRVPIVI
jgi:hypothetical protein